jgi:twitching motility protein PilJ
VQSQRIAKFAPGANRGNADAFIQLKASQQQLEQDLNLLSNGGSYRGRAIPAASSNEHSLLENAKHAGADLARATAFILERKSSIDNFYVNLSKINSLSPDLLELTEQVATLYDINRSTPRELSSAAQLEMLGVRLNRSANLFFVSESINPETAFLLGKDANTFRDITDGFLNGSVKLKLPKVKDNDIRTRLVTLLASFEDCQRSVKSILDDLKNLIGLKQAELVITIQSESLRNRLLELQEVFQKELDT